MFGIKKRKFLATIGVVILLGVTGLAVWQVLEERAKAARTESEILKGLTAEEIAMVLVSEATADRPSIKNLAENAEKRKGFIRGLKETLSLAAQARRDGMADNEDFRSNFEYKKKILIADLYLAKLSRGKGRMYVVPQEQIDAFWTDKANEAEFESVMKILQEIRKEDAEARDTALPAPKLEGEMLTKARKNWARNHILWKQASGDKEFMSQPAIPIRIKLVEAGILAADYTRRHLSDLQPTEAEIREYLAAHPELDPARKYEKARELLAKVKAGEDFETLAKEYSEDRGSRNRGGIYEDVGPGVLWPEVEKRALLMEPGETTDELVETAYGYHVLRLVSKSVPADESRRSELKYTLRHIVIQKKFEEPGGEIANIPRPFMTPQEIAKHEIRVKKRKDFIASVLQRNPISMPEDAEFELPSPNRKGEGAED